MDKPIALFDLDGTLADFHSAMDAGMRALASPAELAAGTYFPAEDTEEPHIRERRRIVKAKPGFWRNLKPIALGFKVLTAAIEEGYSINILTKAPRLNFPAWSEKVEWCHMHLPASSSFSVNLVEDKGLVYGRVLVDDFPPYIERWLAWRPRGVVLMPRQPWNAQYSHEQVVPVDGDTDINLLMEMLRNARTR